MQITKMLPPVNGGTLYVGAAESTRGRRYQFYVDCDDLSVWSAFREEPHVAPLNGLPYWHAVSTPRGLQDAVRQRFRSDTALVRRHRAERQRHAA